MSGKGVPPGWERIATLVERQFGRRLELKPASDAFTTTGAEIDIYLDGAITAGTELWWNDDESEDEVLHRLVNDHLQDLLVQDLHGEIDF